MIAPMFSQVSNEKTITIDDIKVTGYDPFDYDGRMGGGTSGKVVIKLRNKNGGVAKDKTGEDAMYSYFDDEATSVDYGYGTGAGWYRGIVSAVTKLSKDNLDPFDMGQGLWIDGIDGLSVSIAGQVVEKQVDVPLREGSTATGNPYPVARNIDNVSVSGYDPFDYDGRMGGGTSGKVVIKFLNKNGGVKKDKNNEDMMYSYFDDEATSSDYGYGTGAGWYRGIVSPATKLSGDDVKFEPGEGVWVDGIDGLTLHWQAPVLGK